MTLPVAGFLRRDQRTTTVGLTLVDTPIPFVTFTDTGNVPAVEKVFANVPAVDATAPATVHT
jgi:hypothetical protein